jgi:membrane protein YqaA with SNARE-associated domain
VSPVPWLTKKRAVLALAMLVVAITLISVTLGRDILAGRAPGLGSFGIIHFAGYLFFLLMPVEALVPYYQSEGYVGPVLILVAVVTAVVAQVIDYAIGFAVSEEVIRDVVGARRYQRVRHAIHRHGRWALIVFNLFPLSSPNLLLVSGMIRFPLRDAVLYSLIGLVAKYTAIVYVFQLF